MSSSGSAVRRGRPRSLEADAAILAAARAVLAEHGWSGFSVEGVAARAGVAKTTVYRRFPSRDELGVDAVAGLLDDALGGLEDEPDPAARVRRTIRSVAEAYRLPEARAAYLAVVAAAERDPELRATVDRRMIEPSRQRVVDGLALGVSRGEVSPAVADQADLLFDVLAGALLHRLLVRDLDADEAFVEGLAHAILTALRSA